MHVETVITHVSGNYALLLFVLFLASSTILLREIFSVFEFYENREIIKGLKYFCSASHMRTSKCCRLRSA